MSPAFAKLPLPAWEAHGKHGSSCQANPAVWLNGRKSSKIVSGALLGMLLGKPSTSL